MITVKQDFKIEGISLMSGKESSVRISPSNTKGVCFYVNGSTKPIIAEVNNVVSTNNCVVLSNNEKNLKLVEHFLAACAFLNIDSLKVEVDSDEMPILDGSSLEWVKAFNQAGIEEKPSQKIGFNKPLYYENEKTTIALLPSDRFKISYCVDFDNPNLSKKWENFDKNTASKEFIEARTFGYLKDLEKFQKMGLALGANFTNTVGLTNSGYTAELRSDNEPVKHKILDIIGDLYLSGYNPLDFNAHIIAINAGHKSHVKFAKLIKENMEK